MIENDKKKTEMIKNPFAWKVLFFFSLAIFIVCGLVFIFNYDLAFTKGDIIPGSFGIAVYYFFIAVISFIAAVVIKALCVKRVYLRTLLLAAIFLPIICFNLNYYTLQKDGFFYPLVDEGGIFHFIVEGDYNLDGMNDRMHHLRYDERIYRTGSGGGPDDTVINTMHCEFTGTGTRLNGCYGDFDDADKVIRLYLEKDGLELKNIKITVQFYDASIAEKVTFYLSKSSGKILKHTVNADNTVTIEFGEKTCANWQRFYDKDSFEVLIHYEIDGLI